MEEDTPESSSIDDFDFFDVKRRQRLDILSQKKRTEALCFQNVKAARDFFWRNAGVGLVSALHHTLRKFGSVLTPFNCKKVCLQELENKVSEAASLPFASYFRGWVSTKLLRCICGFLWGRRYFNSIQHFRHKFEVMKEVVMAFKFSKPFKYAPRMQIDEMRVVRHLFRVYQHMDLDRQSMALLEKKRYLCRAAQSKLELIQRTIKSCLYIYECRSIQHDNPRFCGHCGVGECVQ
jgi:hypothetical protein